MIETREPEAIMNETELVDTVNKVIDLVGTYSELCAKSRELTWCLNVHEEEYDAVNKEASETYRDILASLYNIANTYTIDGRTEFFPVREMRRRESKHE